MRLEIGHIASCLKEDIRSSNPTLTAGDNAKSKHYYLKIAISLAFSYWFLESTIHYILDDKLGFEVIPSDLNELWMRCAILILLVGFGVFADYHSEQIKQKEAEKYAVYTAMLDASNHIVRNYLTKMHLFSAQAEKSEDFSKDAVEQYEAMIDDAIRQLEKLENIQSPSKSIIEERYRPR